MAEASRHTGKHEESLALGRRILAEFPSASVWQNRKVHEHIAACLRKLDRPRAIRAFYEEWEKKDPDAHFRQKWCFAVGECYASEKDPTAALAAFRRVIAGHCGANCSDYWYDAQEKIVDLLADSGDLRTALQEAHLLLDACRPNTLGQEFTRITGLFVKLDKNRVRADRFLAYQLYGPAGPEGKLDTADDLRNPLDEIGYPADSARRRAFAEVFAGLGNDAAAAHHRGLICLYAGQPRAALYYFMDAARRCEIGKFPDYAVTLLVNGLRPVQGHAVGLTDAVRYALFGPNGEDGKPGTADDQADPLRDYASFTPAAPFVVPPISPRDVQLIGQLQTSLAACAADQTWPADVRGKALSALARLNETSDSWPQYAGWYRNLLKEDVEFKLRRAIVQGAISAARGRELHLGSVWSFLAALDTGQEPDKLARSFRKDIHALEQLQRPGALLPKIKPPSPNKGKKRQ